MKLTENEKQSRLNYSIEKNEIVSSNGFYNLEERIMKTEEKELNVIKLNSKLNYNDVLILFIWRDEVHQYLGYHRMKNRDMINVRQANLRNLQHISHTLDVDKQAGRFPQMV